MSFLILKRQKRRIQRCLRILFRIDISHRIGRFDAVLPPDHLLAEYQKDLPFYDRYFIEFLRRYAVINPSLCVIDIGANVGDTALAVLTAAPNARVICVEGSPYFLRYLRLNTGCFDSVQVIDGVVAHRRGNWSLVTKNGTGHLVENLMADISSRNIYTPDDILKLAGNCGSQIWKSDTDGHDIPMLLGSFDEIISDCEVVWIELYPIGNISANVDIEPLLTRIGGLQIDREVVIFDNYGHLLLRVPARVAPDIIRQLISWVATQESGSGRIVGYFDIWILPPQAAEMLADTARQLPSQ